MSDKGLGIVVLDTNEHKLDIENLNTYYYIDEILEEMYKTGISKTLKHYPLANDTSIDRVQGSHKLH